MATRPDLNDPKELERWLSDKPIDWAQTIAARAALRVFPVVFTSRIAAERRGELILAVTRAAFISWAARKYPAPYMVTVALAAARAAAAFTARRAVTFAFVRANAADVAAAAASAARAAASDFAAAAAAAAADAAAFAAAGAAALAAAYTADRAVVADVVDALERTSGVISAKDRDSGLIDYPLWSDGIPRWAAKTLEAARNYDVLTEHGFAPWIVWYETLLPANPRATPSDYFGEALTLRIAMQPDEWWKRPAKDVNADIVRWLEEQDQIATDAPALEPAIIALPKSTPAPVNFVWRADALEAQSPDTTGDAAGLAQDYLNEARDQALHTQGRIGGNADPSVIRVVARVAEALPERVETVRPAILDARCLALGAFLARYDAMPMGERELSEEALADLAALALMLQKLCALLPDLAREAVESMAKDLEGKEEAARPALVAIVREAAAAAITGISARPVLEVLSEELSRPPNEPERRRWLAIAGTTIRDWLLEAGRFARKPVDVVTRELKALATEAYAKARPKLVDKAADALVTGATAGVVGGVLVVIKAIVGDLEVLAKTVKGFDEILRLAREVMKFFKGKDPP